jgi:probable F420-dependent oxidoreductase
MGAHWPHALTAMSFLAGATSRVTVISAVVILPLHNPVVLAKEIATLDVLSGGRLIVAFGVGHAAEEFEALGVRFDQRGRMADEYLEAMSVLWTEDAPSYDGRYVRFADIRFEPKPLQKPHPPLWIGGNSPASLRRAARWQGWFPWKVTAAELPARLAELRRDPAFEDTGSATPRTPLT